MSEQTILYRISQMIDQCADEGGYDPEGDVILDNFCRDVADLLGDVGAHIASLESSLATTDQTVRILYANIETAFKAMDRCGLTAMADGIRADLITEPCITAIAKATTEQGERK